ncbi:hypothetical protein WJX73_002180 [Symbiochloris irregularis]|uniref:Beta-glucosidase n=1 Tax=Symbiochloris irregularis TaxID=706552 RepID=A0AAW1NTQ4_9CHLO
MRVRQRLIQHKHLQYLLCLVFAVAFLHAAVAQSNTTAGMTDSNKQPPPFVFGTASAAYQIEGAWNEGGRLPSIWDTFSQMPGKVANNENGNVADDFYHRWQEDVELMKSLGVQLFRFSLSWPRIIPKGRGEVNQAGIAFYSRLIDALLAAGIEPHITLYHWDLPQALEDEYLGWLGERVVDDFAAYAAVCFNAFSDRVKYFTTFNEPLSFVFIGYDQGIHAPGRCSDRSRCAAGNSSTEPWIATHHVLLAHVAAVQQLRSIAPDAKVSINFNTNWGEPMTNSREDLEASQRYLDFNLGVYADPCFLGDYPSSVRKAVPSLPHFTTEQKAALKKSVDYFALNHYTTNWVSASDSGLQKASTTYVRDGAPIGPQADSEWLYVVPWGMRRLLNYVNKRYHHPAIYITESGVDVPNENSMPFPDVLQDDFRIDYYREYIENAVLAATVDGVDVRAYFAWSILDNFEWADGYSKRFGITYVDYKNGLKRTPKQSAYFLAKLFGRHPNPGT